MRGVLVQDDKSEPLVVERESTFSEPRTERHVIHLRFATYVTEVMTQVADYEVLLDIAHLTDDYINGVVCESH